MTSALGLSVESQPWPAGRAAVGFLSEGVLREVAQFNDPAEALRAGQECDGSSVIVWTDDDGVPHTRWCGNGPAQLPPALAEEMLAAGYRANGIRRRPRWAREHKFQAEHQATGEPEHKPVRRKPVRRKSRRQSTSTPKEMPMTEPTDDEAAAIINAERKAGKLLARLGVNRRAALAYREVADLRAAGASAEDIEAAEQLAQALTDVALSDLDADDG